MKVDVRENLRFYSFPSQGHVDDKRTLAIGNREVQYWTPDKRPGELTLTLQASTRVLVSTISLL